MAEPSPRPTREQVDAAVRYADECCSPDDPAAIVRHLRATSAEVRALRAELAKVNVEVGRAWLALPHGPHPALHDDSLAGHIRAALVARTPQPAAPDWVDDGVEHWETAGFWIERDATGRDGPTWRLNGDVVSRWVVERFRDALTAALSTGADRG